MELNDVALWLGYAIILSLLLAIIAFLLWLAYLVYDLLLKRLLGWEHKEVRENIIYFIRNKDKISEIIRKEKEQPPQAAENK